MKRTGITKNQKQHKMENTYWFRFYLICSKAANNLLGLQEQNFADLFNELELGRIGNAQMTSVFENVNATLCEICGNETDGVFEENNFDEISRISTSDLNDLYDEYCLGKIELNQI